MKLPSLTMTLASSVLLSAAALAQDDAGGAVPAEEQAEPEETLGKPLSERIQAVSRKIFLKKNRFELAPSAGFTVNDAFFRSYFFQLDAAYHIIEPFSVELRLGIAPLDEKLEPVRYLRDEVSSTPIDLTRPFYLVDLSGTFTPLYGKISLFADWIWHYDLYLAAGGGLIGVWKISSVGTNQATALSNTAMLGLGGGMRGFINEWLVVHIDVRDYLYPTVTQSLGFVQNVLVLSAGVGFFFPFGFEHEYEGYRVES
ncbi:MAG: outer membrane beta-barrel domain-containing protein [Deltaproteobacteria bacterium]|nr:outer membrane beta-barrel domain-containing protein [Deltaproteobacteria bacterium]